MKNLYLRIRKNIILNRGVINLRYLIGLGFIPSGLVKVMNQPFTNPENTGVFAEFLHALHATGFYYNTVGLSQMLAAVLLMTQRFATLGALLFLPIIFNIMVLTLSTIGSLTPIIASLMFLGTLFLLLWDLPKWINVFRKDQESFSTNWASDFPTFNEIDLFTGLALLCVPVVLTLTSLKELILISIPLILLMGNILSHLHYPLLKKRTEV